MKILLAVLYLLSLGFEGTGLALVIRDIKGTRRGIHEYRRQAHDSFSQSAYPPNWAKHQPFRRGQWPPRNMRGASPGPPSLRKYPSVEAAVNFLLMREDYLSKQLPVEMHHDMADMGDRLMARVKLIRRVERFALETASPAQSHRRGWRGWLGGPWVGPIAVGVGLLLGAAGNLLSLAVT